MLWGSLNSSSSCSSRNTSRPNSCTPDHKKKDYNFVSRIRNVRAPFKKYISIYLTVSLFFLFQESCPVRKHHLKYQPDVDDKMRSTLIDWLMQVHAKFQLLQETLFLSVALVDRYLQVGPYSHVQVFAEVFLTFVVVCSQKWNRLKTGRLTLIASAACELHVIIETYRNIEI